LPHSGTYEYVVYQYVVYVVYVVYQYVPPSLTFTPSRCPRETHSPAAATPYRMVSVCGVRDGINTPADRRSFSVRVTIFLFAIMRSSKGLLWVAAFAIGIAVAVAGVGHPLHDFDCLSPGITLNSTVRLFPDAVQAKVSEPGRTGHRSSAFAHSLSTLILTHARHLVALMDHTGHVCCRLFH
jgi:hypothetical protein